MGLLLVNLLGTLTVALCAVLLLRAYARVGKRLLLWSGLCFVGLTAANGLMLVNHALIPGSDLFLWRLGLAAGSILLLLYGLIWESD